VALVRALELAGLAALRLGGGERATAERAARRLVELAPLRESGTRLLMEVLAADGNRAEALLVYESLRSRLREELGVAPSAETQALHRSLLA
jgi:DNA-binding SARP family transcriptional activator